MQIPFLTPTDKDVFSESNLAHKATAYKIEFEKSFIEVEIQKTDDGVSFNVLNTKFESDYDMKKLFGYVFFKIVTRYSKN